MPFRLDIHTKCNADDATIKANLAYNRAKRYPKVTWNVAAFSPCAVVGGSPAIAEYLPILREWRGDIFAINDTAGYLSDNGIPCYLFMIDAGSDPIKEGNLIKGAVLATRCAPMRFKYDSIRVYDMLEDKYEGGVEGGPTAPCRAPHLFLRMGYMGVDFFGCDSCFYDNTHINSDHPEYLENALVVRAGGIDYLTNTVFLAQAEYLASKVNRHPQFIRNHGKGLLQAIIDNPDTWEVVALSQDIINQHPENSSVFSKQYSGKVYISDAAKTN